MAFLGEFNHNIDPKNRVFIPSKFREELGDSFVLCKAPDKCLFIYANSVWDELASEIYNLPPSPQSRQIQRDIFRNAINVEPDKQGRITINAKLAEYAGLSHDAVIVGAGKRIEIWDAAEWEKNTGEMDKLVNDDALKIEVHY